MRKWRDLAAPEDPSAWYDLDGFVPTNRATYEAVDIADAGSTYTAVGSGSVLYAFYGLVPNPNTINAEYVVDDAKIWQYDASSVSTKMVDRTGSAGIGRPQMAQYGNVTLCVMGSPRGSLSGVATVAATLGGNFSTVVGAPQADCITVESNAVVLANTDTANDGWAASDVGDYTNWSTGEATSGRIYNPAGPIKAAVSFNGAVYVFKANSIHRLRYVGGTVKWAVEKLFEGLGCSITNMAIAGLDGILFLGGSNKTGNGDQDNKFFWFDGVNVPVAVNTETTIGDTKLTGPMMYNRFTNTYMIWQEGDGEYDPVVFFFNPSVGAWGRSSVSYDLGVKPLCGDARSARYLPRGWAKVSSNTLTFYNTIGLGTPGTRYITTSMYGVSHKKTLFSRLIPLLRRRYDIGSAAMSATGYYYRERFSTTYSLESYNESANRARFDFSKSENFARFKMEFTDYDVEMDDVFLGSKPVSSD